MTSFSEVLALAKTASEALNALEVSQHSSVLSTFTKFENGLMPVTELRAEMLSQATAGFVTAGSVALEHVIDLAKEAGISSPKVSLLQTAPVLEHILDDIRKNMEVFNSSEKNDTALRRLRFRVGLSVQQATRRGFTENQLAAAESLRENGAVLKKVWLANFTNNAPCPTCRALHGSEVSLSTEFDHGDEKSPKTFLGLQGPPRHPNCHCYMLIYVSTLDTVVKIPQAPVLEDQKFMTAKDVRRLPKAVYTAAITTLRLIAGILKGAIRGKR